MAYGALLKNQNDSLIVGQGEQTYLYWGKLTQTIAGGGSFTNAPEISLFNLPSTYDVITYAYCEGNNHALFTNSNSGSNWVTKVSLESGFTITVHIYVFVLAKDIALPDYGMATYHDDGTVQYHTGRPCLTYEDFRTYSGVSPLTPITVNDYQPMVQVGSSHGQSMITTTPSGYYDGNIWNIYAQKTSADVKTHGLGGTRVFDNTGGTFPGPVYSLNETALPIVYAIADAGYFDGFTSLDPLP